MSLNKNMLWSSFIFLFTINSRVYLSSLFSNPEGQLVSLLILYALSTSLLVCIYQQTIKGHRIKKVSAKRIISFGCLGVVFSFLFQFMMIEISQLLNLSSMMSTSESVFGQGHLDRWYLLIPMIFTPVMEELVFRFSIIQFLNQKLPLIMSVIISSLLFAFMHGNHHIITYTGLGILFYLIYRYSGSLLSAIMAHIGMNMVIILIQ